jgi:hypothetical protein
MSSPGHSDRRPLDLATDVPTTAADVDALRQASRETTSWLTLTPAELETLIPEGALERRPPIRADAKPFTLP